MANASASSTSLPISVSNISRTGSAANAIPQHKAASRAIRRVMLFRLRSVNPCLSPSERIERNRWVDSKCGIHNLLLRALQVQPGALHIDFFGSLGRVRQHPHMVRQHLDEAALHGEV